MTAPLPPTSPEKGFVKVEACLGEEFQIVIGEYRGPWDTAMGAAKDALEIESRHYAALEALKERCAKIVEDFGKPIGQATAQMVIADSIRSMDVRRG